MDMDIDTKLYISKIVLIDFYSQLLYCMNVTPMWVAKEKLQDGLLHCLQKNWRKDASKQRSYKKEYSVQCTAPTKIFIKIISKLYDRKCVRQIPFGFLFSGYCTSLYKKIILEFYVKDLKWIFIQSKALFIIYLLYTIGLYSWVWFCLVVQIEIKKVCFRLNKCRF